MNGNRPHGEDGGYGNSSLVGSTTAGTRSAIEARRAVDPERRHDDAQADDATRPDGDIGRLADAPPPGVPRAGVPAMQDVQVGVSAPSAPRDARDDANRLEP
jgi:hypothetical protein